MELKKKEELVLTDEDVQRLRAIMTIANEGLGLDHAGKKQDACERLINMFWAVLA